MYVCSACTSSDDFANLSFLRGPRTLSDFCRLLVGVVESGLLPIHTLGQYGHKTRKGRVLFQSVQNLSKPVKCLPKILGKSNTECLKQPGDIHEDLNMTHKHSWEKNRGTR